MEYEIDIERLRKDLKDYYGTAMFNASPLAMMDLARIENTSDDQLLEIAQNQGIDIGDYLL